MKIYTLMFKPAEETRGYSIGTFRSHRRAVEEMDVAAEGEMVLSLAKKDGRDGVLNAYGAEWWIVKTDVR